MALSHFRPCVVHIGSVRRFLLEFPFSFLFPVTCLLQVVSLFRSSYPRPRAFAAEPCLFPCSSSSASIFAPSAVSYPSSFRMSHMHHLFPPGSFDKNTSRRHCRITNKKGVLAAADRKKSGNVTIRRERHNRDKNQEKRESTRKRVKAKKKKRPPPWDRHRERLSLGAGSGLRVASWPGQH